MANVTITQAGLEKLIDDRFKLKLETHDPFKEDPKATVKTSTAGILDRRIAFYEKKLGMYKLQVTQTALSLKQFFGFVLTGNADLSKQATLLVKFGIGVVKLIPGLKILQAVFKAQNSSMKKNWGNWGMLTKISAGFGLVLTGIVTMLMVLLTVVLSIVGVVVLLSLALEGSESGFYKWFQGLTVFEKMGTVLVFVTGLLWIFGGAWSLIMGGVAGLLRVVTQEMGVMEGVITTIISILMILGGVFLLIGSTAAFPFIAVGLAILGVGILWRKFSDEFKAGWNSLLDAVEEKLKSWGASVVAWYNKWIQPIIDGIRLIGHTVGGVFSGQGLSSYGNAHDKVYGGGNNVTVNLNGPANASTARDVGREVSYVLRTEDRRQGGASTTGAYPGG